MTIRNLGLVIAGLVALYLAIWRGLVAQKQADAAQQSLRNERYQKGAEMLGSNVLSVRLGGIYALHRLAEEHPNEYHIQIMNLFCAFIRDPSNALQSDGTLKREVDKPSTREDVQSALQMIFERSEERIALERDVEFYLEFDRADLRYLDLWTGDLSGSSLMYTDLSFTTLWRVKISHTHLWETKMCCTTLLPKVDLKGATLFKVKLNRSYLVGTNFTNATLLNVDMSDTKLSRVNMAQATLIAVNISGADFTGLPNRSDGELYISSMEKANKKIEPLTPPQDLDDTFSMLIPGPVAGLTQGQLDMCFADPDKPPKLDGVLDAKTGRQLIWRGRSSNPLESLF